MNLIYNFIKSTSHYLINNNITKEGKGKEKRELHYMVSKVVFTLVTFSHIALQNSMTIYIKKIIYMHEQQVIKSVAYTQT